MTQRQKAYEQRNLLGFEGDTFMKEKVKSIIKEYGIELVIEGGTYLGGTARQFAQMAPQVVTIEIDDKNYERASILLKSLDNVELIHGSTVDVLPKLLKKHKNKKILWWSDAHWLEHNPMIKEMRIIAKSGIRPVMAIHDFKVPGRPDLGFDTYKDIVYEWSWIEPSIKKIYGDDFIKEYNDKATGAKRGIVYIYPK